MSRKRKAPVRKVYPDPKFHSEVVSKFINSIMYDGKRSTAEKILYDALDKIKSKNILGHSDVAPERKKDPGEKFPWEKLSKKKIGLWHSISARILKKNRDIKLNKMNENIFYNNLIKIGYMTAKFKNFRKKKFKNYIVKAFQRRFRQELVNGKIDKECLIISQNLTDKFK